MRIYYFIIEENIIENGYLDFVKYLRDKWMQESCHIAVNFNQLEILKFLHEIGFIADEESFLIAMENEFIEILKYLHEKNNNFKYSNRKFLSIAISKDKLKSLRFLCEKGYETYHECICAVSEGKLEALKIMHGYEW